MTVATAASPFVTVAVWATTKLALRERTAKMEGNNIARRTRECEGKSVRANVDGREREIDEK